MEPPDEPSISGALKRKNMIGLWSPRHCWLIDKTLYISKDKDFSHVKKQIQITPETQILLDDKGTPQFTVQTGDQKYVFSSILPEVLSWVFTLRACKKKDKSYTIDDFRIIQVLGRGFYGKVMLVEKLDTGVLYALKTIRKKKLMDISQLSTVLAERNLLSGLPPFPFIVNLCFCFQTDHKFYLGLEYAPGGELLQFLSKLPVLPIDDTRLYIAEIALAIHHLHVNHIIYRDLKPENVLLDSDGHIKLTDFGLSIKTEDDRASTFCGTAEYLAPEILLQRGYSYEVDWWALGCLLYEIIHSETPFFDENQDTMFENILTKEPQFPKYGHKAATDLMRALLVKDPAQRLDFEHLQQHPFFHGLTWERVERKEVKPSTFQPVKETEPSNFCSEFTIETPADSVVQSINPTSWNISGFSFGVSDGTVAPVIPDV